MSANKRKRVEDRALFGKRFDVDGCEISDDTPVEVPVEFEKPPTLQEDMRRMIRQEMSLAAESAGMESFEEADDFDVEGEDEAPECMHDYSEMQEEFLNEKLKEVDKDINKRYNSKSGNSATVKGDDDDVYTAGVEGDSLGAVGAGEKRAAVGGKGRAAGKRGGGVSKGVEGVSRDESEGGDGV